MDSPGVDLQTRMHVGWAGEKRLDLRPNEHTLDLRGRPQDARREIAIGDSYLICPLFRSSKRKPRRGRRSVGMVGRPEADFASRTRLLEGHVNDLRSPKKLRLEAMPDWGSE